MTLLLSWLFLLLLGLTFLPASAKTATPLRGKTQNIILVTYDGLRWQEVFRGADPELMNKEQGGVGDAKALHAAFGRETPEARRQALLPFLWTVVAPHGQIFGNQDKGSVAKVTNGLNFSYPGYHEILTGYADDRIDSNEKGLNPNKTVLEWLQQKPAYRHRIAAFCSWKTFEDILNRPRSGLVVRAGRQPMFGGKMNPRQQLLNELIRDTEPAFDSVVNDSLMFYSAMEFLNEHKPRVFYLAFAETDDWSHHKRYDRLLHSAYRTDRLIQTLWETVQSLPSYRGKTTLILTTDHGRGDTPSDWKDHGKKTPGSENIWMAFLGPDTPALGERTQTSPVTQAQVAATLAALLGEDYHAAVPQAAPPILEVLKGGRRP